MKQTILMKRLIIIAIFCLSAAVAVAQGGPGDPGGDPGGGPIGAIPVDGGLAFLLAAGVGYGAKKMHERRNKVKVKS